MEGIIGSKTVTLQQLLALTHYEGSIVIKDGSLVFKGAANTVFHLYENDGIAHLASYESETPMELNEDFDINTLQKETKYKLIKNERERDPVDTRILHGALQKFGRRLK
jgi:hypothetical protein